MNTVVEEVCHPVVGDSAPDVSILRASDGEEFALSTLWQDGPAVLIFLRHLGCTFCKEHTAQLRRDLPRFVESRVRLGLITVGQPAETAAFCADRDLVDPFLCLSDPDKAAYHAYGLSRVTPAAFFTPHVLARGFQAALHGHFNGLPKGDPLQMPGVFLVDRSGIVRYAHRSRDAADNPANAEIFAVLEEPFSATSRQ